ncbi:RNA-dependent RNA polymerase [Wuhan pillworm virus 1]|uniref:RNA-dependent RNA polymerase n=1 Tax=Wuhan pillworm virus 1 TaxID=1923744 RepID=UPI00090C465E|nr:RNA-dependent RNA polymerase [Wuhan pillworm virus 1]APG79337.1 RNA-dependent RNA polymerase [Wuhan pillworm virus 1]
MAHWIDPDQDDDKWFPIELELGDDDRSPEFNLPLLEEDHEDLSDEDADKAGPWTFISTIPAPRHQSHSKSSLVKCGHDNNHTDSPENESADYEIRKAMEKHLKRFNEMVKDDRLLIPTSGELTIKGFWCKYFNYPYYIEVYDKIKYSITRSPNTITIRGFIDNMHFDRAKGSWLRIESIIMSFMRVCECTALIPDDFRMLLVDLIIYYQLKGILSDGLRERHVEFLRSSEYNVSPNIGNKPSVEVAISKLVEESELESRVFLRYKRLPPVKRSYVFSEPSYPTLLAVESAIKQAECQNLRAISSTTETTDFLNTLINSKTLDYKKLVESVPPRFRASSQHEVGKISRRLIQKFKDSADWRRFRSPDDISDAIIVLYYTQSLVAEESSDQASVALSVVLADLNDGVDDFNLKRSLILSDIDAIWSTCQLMVIDETQRGEFESIIFLIRSCMSAEEMISMVNYLKGTTGEIMLCNEFDLNYKQEVNKPTMKEILLSWLDADACTTMAKMLLNASILGAKPDNSAITSVHGLRKENRFLRFTHGLAKDSEDKCLISANGGFVVSDIASFNVDELTDSDEEILIIYEFSWVYEPKVRCLNDLRAWSPLISASSKLGWKIIIRSVSLGNNCTSFFRESSSARTMMESSFRSAFGRLKACMSLSESIVRLSAESMWPTSKNYKQIDFHDPGPTEDQYQRVVATVIDELKSDYQYRDPELIKLIEKEIKREPYKSIATYKNVLEGVEFLSICFEEAKLRCRRIVCPTNWFSDIRAKYRNKLLEFNYMGENFKTIRSYYEVTIKKLIPNDCLIGVDDSTKPLTRLDKLLKFNVPSQTAGEKQMARRIRELKLTIAKLKGLALISLNDGSLSTTKVSKSLNMLKDDLDNSTVHQILLEHFSDVTSCYKSNDSKLQLKSRIKAITDQVISALSENLEPKDHNSFRDPLVLSVVNDHNLLGKGSTNQMEVIKKLLLADQISPVDEVRCELPNQSEMQKKVDELFKSFKLSDKLEGRYSKWLYELYLGTEDVNEWLKTSGFLNEYFMIFKFVMDILSRISYFRELTKMMLISESFIKIYKRKKGGSVISTRVRATNLRLYIHKHRNYNESFNCLIMNDKGAVKMKLRLNERHARLWLSLPKMLIHFYISNNQEDLYKMVIMKDQSLSDELNTTSYLQCINEVQSSVRRVIESFYNDEENQFSLWRTLLNADTFRLTCKLIGCLLVTHLRHTASSENNETASVIRYCIMAQSSKLADLPGIAEKIARKCRTGWDLIESLLIEDVLQNVTNRPNTYDMINCSRLYMLGFAYPSDASEMINCMYTMHMYPRGLGNWKDAVRKAHRAYLDVHILYEADAPGNEKRLTGDVELNKWFQLWQTSSEDNRREVIRKCADKLSLLMSQDTKAPSWSSWVVELASNIQKMNLDRDVISSLIRCKELSVPITAIAEPTSVIEEMIEKTEPSVLANEYVMSRDSRLKNIFSQTAKRKKEDLNQNVHEVKEELKKNPELLKLFDNAERNSICISRESLTNSIKAFDVNSLISDNRDEEIIHIIKGVNKIFIRGIESHLNSRENFKIKVNNSILGNIKGETEDWYRVDCLKEVGRDECFDIFKLITGFSVIGDQQTLVKCNKMCNKLQQMFKIYMDDQSKHCGVVDLELCRRIEESEKLLLTSMSDCLKTEFFKTIVLSAMSGLNWCLRYSPTNRKFIMRNYPMELDPVIVGGTLGESSASVTMMRYFLSKTSYSKSLKLSMYRSLALSDLKKGIQMLYLSANVNVVIQNYLENTVEIMTNRMSVIRVKMKSSNSRSLLRNSRCKSIEIFMEVMRNHGNTKLFEIGRNLAMDEFRSYKFGIAPKDQFMGMRELAILEYNTKIMMAFVEGVSSHILRGIGSDLLRNPKRKTAMLEHMTKNFNSKSNWCHFWSGDRTKWGPKHFYLVFICMMKVVLKESPLLNIVLSVLCKGLSKRVEIPFPSIESTMNKLMDKSGIKSENRLNIGDWLKKLFDRLKTISDKDWLYKIILGSHDDEAPDENMVESDIIFWADDIVLNLDLEVIIDIIMSYGLSRDQLFCLYHLSKGRTSHIMLYHMNQGIPHLTSSILGNSALSLTKYLFESYITRNYPSLKNAIEILYVTSSDDYAITMVADKSLVTRSIFDKLVDMLDGFQIMTANLCNIKDSVKSVAGSSILEVYSVFNVRGQITPATIKFTSNSLLPPNQPTPLSMNEENLSRIQQIVDNGGTEIDICLWQALKLNQTLGYIGFSEIEKMVLRGCSGLLNYGICVPYENVLLGDSEVSLMLPTLRNIPSLNNIIKLSDDKLCFLLRKDVKQSLKSRKPSKLVTSIIALMLDDIILSSSPKLSDCKVTSGRKHLSSGFLRDPFPPPSSYKLMKQKLEETMEKFGGDDHKQRAEAFYGELKVLTRMGLTNDLRVELVRCSSAIKSNKLSVILTDSSSNIMYSYLSRAYRNNLLKLNDVEKLMPKHASWDYWQDPDIADSFKSDSRFKLTDVIHILYKRIMICFGEGRSGDVAGWLDNETIEEATSHLISSIRASISNMSKIIENQFGSEGTSYREVLGRSSKTLLVASDRVSKYDHSIKCFSHYGVNPGRKRLNNKWPVVLCYIMDEEILTSGTVRIDNVDLLELDKSIIIASCGSPPSSSDTDKMKDWLFLVEQKFSDDFSTSRLSFCISSDNRADWKQLHDMIDLNRIRGYMVNTTGIKLDTSQMTNYQESRVTNFVTVGSCVGTKDRESYLNYFRRSLMEDPKGGGMSIITSFGKAAMNVISSDNNINKAVRILLMERHTSDESQVHCGEMFISGNKCQFITDGTRLIYYIPATASFFSNESSLKALKPFLITFIALMQGKRSFKIDSLLTILKDSSYSSDETDLSITRAGYTCKKLMQVEDEDIIFADALENEYAVRFYIKETVENIHIDKSNLSNERELTSYRQTKLDRGGLCTRVTLVLNEQLNVLPTASLWAKLIKDPNDPFMLVLERVMRNSPEMNLTYDENKIKASSSLPWYSVESIADSTQLLRWFATEPYSVADWFNYRKLDSDEVNLFSRTIQCRGSLTSAVRLRDITVPSFLSCDLGRYIFLHRPEVRSELRQDKIKSDFVEFLTDIIDLNQNADFILLKLAMFQLEQMDNSELVLNKVRNHYIEKDDHSTCLKSKIGKLDSERRSQRSHKSIASGTKPTRSDLKKELSVRRQTLKKMFHKFINTLNNIHFIPSDCIQSGSFNFRMSSVGFSDDILIIRNVNGERTRLLDLSNYITWLDSVPILKISTSDIINKAVSHTSDNKLQLPQTRSELKARVYGTVQRARQDDLTYDDRDSNLGSDNENDVQESISRSTSISSFTGMTRFSDRDRENVVEQSAGEGVSAVGDDNGDFIASFLRATEMSRESGSLSSSRRSRQYD